MIPPPAVLIVGGDDEDVAPHGTVHNGPHNLVRVRLAAQRVRIAGMLVVCSDRFDERHRRQAAGREILEEVFLIPQMLRLRGRAVSIGGKERKRLVVELE